MGSQSGKDALVHSDDSHHSQSCHGDERRTLDARNTLDGLPVVVYMVFDERTGMVGVEGVLHLDGYVLDADGIDGRRIDDLCTKVAELHRLDVGEFVDGVCGLDDTWICGHEPVDIRPNLQHLGSECRSYDACRIVAASTSQVGCLHRVSVARDEARYHAHPRHVFKRFLYQSVGELCIQRILSVFLLRAYKVAGIHAPGTTDERRHDVGRETFTIRHDGILRLCAEVVDEEDTEVDGTQLL